MSSELFAATKAERRRIVSDTVLRSKNIAKLKTNNIYLEKTMLIKVIKKQQPTAWYNDFVGKVFRCNSLYIQTNDKLGSSLGYNITMSNKISTGSFIHTENAEIVGYLVQHQSKAKKEKSQKITQEELFDPIGGIT